MSTAPQENCSLAELLASLNETERAEALSGLTEDQADALLYDWEFWARPNQKTPAGDWRNWLLLAGRGFGKALSLETPIPTPYGWKRNGDLVSGDVVFDEAGSQCAVVVAHPVLFGRPCFRVRFSDHSSIVADADHLWETETHSSRKSLGRAKCPTLKPKVRTTWEIAQTLWDGKEHNHSIRLALPLRTREAELPIHPYVLGAWLGDGSSASGSMTIDDADAELVMHIAEAGERCEKRRRVKDRTPQYALGFRELNRDAITGRMIANGSVHSRLKALGLLSNKHIPALYLRASIEQRLELLKGLMDTDGSVQPSGNVEFSSMRKVLAEHVLELSRSLGFKPTMEEGRAMLRGVDVGAKFRITWTPHVSVFKLTRKLSRQHSGKSQALRNVRRYIVSVEPVESVPVRCVTVDSKSSLYLAGEAMIPTHNTRTGASQVKKWESEGKRRIALIAPTAGDARDVMVEGESGLLSCYPPGMRPTYEPSKRTLTWPSGAIAQVYSAEEPERLRGPQFECGWCDEIASWKYPATWDNFLFGLRLGDDPRTVITTTPKPIALVRELVADPHTIVTRGSTYDNRANLAPAFFDSIIKKYEGTRTGRQELLAEILDDIPGALWTRAMIDAGRIPLHKVPPMRRVVIAIDPAVSANENSAETGIGAVGLGVDDQIYVLEDRSTRGSPLEWAARAFRLFVKWDADRIVAEINQGGDLVESNLRAYLSSKRLDPNVLPFRAVRASRGKSVRAEPVAALYERGIVHHVSTGERRKIRLDPPLHDDEIETLEDQLCSYVPGVTTESPDRMDWLVWGVYDLVIQPVEHAILTANMHVEVSPY